MSQHAQNEKKKASFDVNEGRRALWSVLPERFFDFWDCVKDFDIP